MRLFVSAIAIGTLALLGDVHGAAAQDSKGKNCRMEQQCRWQDFKKICVWVKVCR